MALLCWLNMVLGKTIPLHPEFPSLLENFSTKQRELILITWIACLILFIDICMALTIVESMSLSNTNELILSIPLFYRWKVRPNE